MFAGLSAFPLTPMDERGIDEAAFVRLVARLAETGVDSIGALGSTGHYAYLQREERSRVARLAVSAAGGTPIMLGVGAVRTKHVLELAEDAQDAGAAALLLAPLSYLQTIDPACEVPAKGLLPYRRERPIPFLFTAADIERVMRAARGLGGELHAATTQTLIGLMAVTGMRVGEAIGLARDDVDRPGQMIRVIDGKFGTPADAGPRAGALA